jgi:mono/diheme cytochrome c family protein
MSASQRPRRIGISLRTWVLSGLIGAIVISMAVSLLSQPQRDPQAASVAAHADYTDRELVGRGRQIYATLCANCHGTNLQGAPNWRTPLPDGSMPAPPHDATGNTPRYSDQELFAIVKNGGLAIGPNTHKRGMPAFGGFLKDSEIWAVLAYIKSTWPQDLLDRQGRRQP